MQIKRISNKTWCGSAVQTTALIAVLCQSFMSPAFSYELLAIQYTNTIVLNDAYRVKREALFRAVGEILQDKGLSKSAVISVTLDFDGNVKNLRLVSGSASDQQLIPKIQVEKNFGQLPGLMAPAALTLQFGMNELTQNPFEASKTEGYQTSKVPNLSILPVDASNLQSVGSISITQGTPSTTPLKSAVKQSAYSKTDASYDNAMLTIMLQKEQSYISFNSRSRARIDIGPYLLTQAKLLESSRQFDSAAFVYAAAAFKFILGTEKEQTTKALAECLRVSSKCSDGNKVCLASKLFQMRRSPLTREDEFTGFEDTAKSLLGEFSSNNHQIELARLTLLSKHTRKNTSAYVDVSIDEQILKLTQQIAEEQLSAEVLQANEQLQRNYEHMKEYAKANKSADTEITQSKKKAGRDTFDIIPALCTQLNFCIECNDMPGINSVLKRINAASQDFRSDFMRQTYNAYARSDGSKNFYQSVAFAQRKLSPASFKSIQEQLTKITFRLNASGQRFGNQMVLTLASHLTDAGKAEEALVLLDNGILAQQCGQDNTDNHLQLREIEILEQNEDLVDRNRRLETAKKMQEETLHSTMLAIPVNGSQDQTLQLITVQTEYIKYLLKQKRAAEAQDQFAKFTSALDKAPVNSGNSRFFALLLSLLRTEKDEPSLDRKVVLSTLKSILKRDNSKSSLAEFVPLFNSDKTSIGDEVVALLVEDATAKLGVTAPAMLPMFKNVAAHYRSTENYDSAITYDKKVLQIQLQTNATETDIFKTKAALASNYLSLGELTEADILTREILQSPRGVGSTGLPALVSGLCTKWCEKDEPDRAAELLKLESKTRNTASTNTSTHGSLPRGTLVIGSDTTSLNTTENIIDAFEKRKDYDKAISFINEMIANYGFKSSDEDKQLMQFALARLYLEKCSQLSSGSEEKANLLSKSSGSFEAAIKLTESTSDLKVDWRSNWYANKRLNQLKQLGETNAAEELQKRL